MKKQIRKEALARRAAISVDERASKSLRIADLVLSLPETATAKVITVYVDFRNEVETRDLINRLLALGKTVALPIVHMETGTLSFTAVSSLDCLIKTEKHIWEPAPGSGTDVPIEALDLILTPGAAFDRSGYRLGYGGGFYDKLLEKRRTDVHAIGLAFSEQLVDSLPIEAHDQKLDGIVTENEVIRF